MTDLRDQLQRSLGAHYCIERELGGGGMARVFVAEETSLGRKVVVKLLPDDMAGSVSTERFRREIALAARLQHPHIVSLLTAGEADGIPYYTMPYIEGESLRGRLTHGELSVAESVSILRDVAKALEFAHAKGVTHRDIKPDNVLLAGSSAMLADLGVAKAISDSATENPLTAVGVSVGTPAYMAPEQSSADPSADTRVDIYAFGVLAYEMLAGHTPFAGRNPQAQIAAHATETPTQIGALRTSTPPGLAELVMRCLEKRPGDRPQMATELVRALEALPAMSGTTSGTAQAAAPRRGNHRMLIAALVVVAIAGTAIWWGGRGSDGDGQPIRSIAVLPFENKSGDSTLDYLEDGVTDNVRDALNGIAGLTVKARSSSRQLKGKPPREVGSKLGVAVVLQGTIARSASRLHVTTELVRTSNDAAIWSRTFDAGPNELAGIQDTIAAAVGVKLRGDQPSIPSTRSAAAGSVRGRSRGTNDAEAYDLFLRGRAENDRLNFPEAAKFFQAAIARDPEFARAEGYLASAYANIPIMSAPSLDSIFALARQTARHALSRDSTALQAYNALSIVESGNFRFDLALLPLERAMAIDSSDAELRIAHAFALAQVGRLPEGLAQAQHALQQDPFSQITNGVLAYLLWSSNRIEDALPRVKTTVELDARNVLAMRGLGFALALAGKGAESVNAFESAFRTDSIMFGGRANLLFGYAAAGRWADADAQRKVIERWQPPGARHYYRMMVRLVYGDRDGAMTELEQGVAAREQLLAILFLPCDPLFDPLKASPRFAPLMARVGAHACPAMVRWPIGPPPSSIKR